MPPPSWFFLFLCLSCIFLSIIHGDDGFGVSREVFILEGAPPDVTWVVQISDLHLSRYHPERAEDLKRLLAPALKTIRPSLLLITGDLTDAKSIDRTTTRQDLSEWLQYKQAMEAIARESGMNMRTLIDIRGNHDKYGVPHVGHELDFFSNYSVSSQFNRLSTVQSIALVGTDWNYVFLGLDDSLEVGLRCPSNLFGHTTDQRLEAVSSELEYWRSHLDGLVTNIVFGHFPMSFVASSETGERYESIFSRHSVFTYICGHLHAKFSKQLWRHHLIDSTDGAGQSSKADFWEWELGDWKESKLFRILAIDRGHVSFTDISLLHPPYYHGEGFATAILITYPLDSRSMNRMSREHLVARDDVSALVFSVKPIIRVTAKIFDSFNASELVDEVLLHSSDNSSCLYQAQLNVSKYLHMPPTRFWLQVSAVDIHGNETASGLRPFSMAGELAPLETTWLEYLVLHVRWERLYKVVLWVNIFFLFMMLFLPKVLNIFMEKNMSYQKWATSVSISSPIARRRAIFLSLWFLIEGSRNRKIWCTMALYLSYLLVFPWFWGHAESEYSKISSMSMHGWTIKFPEVQAGKYMLGDPDVMAITLPFMYFIVSPLFVIIYFLFTERSLSYLHSEDKSRCSLNPKSVRPKAAADKFRDHVDYDKSLKANQSIKQSSCKICSGWTRTGLLLASMALLYIHFRQCSYVAHSYGVTAAILSPGLLWWPTLVLGCAIYSSRSVTKSCKSEPSRAQ